MGKSSNTNHWDGLVGMCGRSYVWVLWQHGQRNSRSTSDARSRRVALGVVNTAGGTAKNAGVFCTCSSVVRWVSSLPQDSAPRRRALPEHHRHLCGRGAAVSHHPIDDRWPDRRRILGSRLRRCHAQVLVRNAWVFSGWCLNLQHPVELT